MIRNKSRRSRNGASLVCKPEKASSYMYTFALYDESDKRLCSLEAPNKTAALELAVKAGLSAVTAIKE